MDIDDLNGIMELDHVIRVNADGTITESPTGIYAPEIYVDLDQDGQILNPAEKAMIEYVESQEWDLMTGYSQQYSYSGPIMHPSEYIGGDMARDILETPGLYVAVEVISPDDTDDPIGWVVARKLDE